MTDKELMAMVPPFYTKTEVPESYFWWSWHPNYPYWSKSCWGGKTIEEAYKWFNDGLLTTYHNKLIRENSDGYQEVADEPCKKLHLWRKILERKTQTNSKL